jgi:hypothetical protein
MTPARRIGLIAGGYVGAFLVAAAAVAISTANRTVADAQASSGMYAFGDALLFIAVFGLLALVPTGGLLYVLRPYRGLWVVLSAMALSVAITGAAAASLFALGRDATPQSALANWAAFSILRILLTPVLAPALLVSGLLSPYRFARFALLTATVVEVAVGAYAGFVWFSPLFFHKN